MRVDIVTPERRLASVEASEVQIPGADGDLTAMAGHTPTITTLRPGVLRVVSAEGTKGYVVTGGFAEITAASVSVLAERAVPVEQAAGLLDGFVAEAREAAGMAEDKDAGEKLVNDMLALKAAVAGGH